ncbi:hypothetical protein B5E84_17680, partial [Lachnoclostridium sp. An14]|uniref:hypothetical protein n=1 Tax=Lachnoclostridium sp. An14 TaxID=1965562 RepID=UPI000B55C301
VPEAYTISVILSRPQYCGYNPYCGQLYKGNYDPIITVEMYNRVQMILKRQGKASGRKRHNPLLRVPEK